MGKYGYKIKNFQAGSLYEYNLGLRDNYDYTEAMLTNSLFSDFMVKNGLNIWKEESTRDIICIDFKYGSRSYGDEKKHLIKIAKEARFEYKLAKSFNRKDEILKYKRKRKKISELYCSAQNNRDVYDKKSKKEIREIFYTEGVDVEYKTHNKKGKVIKTEIIHYKMLYRTPGKAKKGSCMFINEKLYDIARDFLYMGIKLPYNNSPIVEMGAYSSLITSSIVGTIEIDPKSIFIMKDIDSFFNRKVISVETDEDKHCRAVEIDDYKLKNTLFDGQGLIDSSIFPEWGNGYILLRHHLCKMATFCTNIQLFFKDYFGDEYETAKITDMFGVEHYVKDIKLITTDNAMKWLKFDVSYEYWCQKVNENGNMFGIVKTAHESKLGRVQRMSYQMINSLDIDIMDEVTKCSVEYVEKLKKDDSVFLKHLEDNKNFSNDFEVLIALCKHNPEFVRSEYYRDRKKEIIRAYVLNLKNGRIVQNADNLVIVGSPYAMLLVSVGESELKDDTFCHEAGTIQCYAERFEDGEYLACFRSPFNSKNNMGYLHNVYDERFKKYFNFGEQIIAVNLINTDFQDRNNGSDQDSDSVYTTNQKNIVEYAKYCYENYPTIVNNIPKEKNKYTNTLENFAIIDNNLMAAQLAIGESSNLAQICLTYTYNFEDKKYQDYVCILSVLAQVAIDNAKRSFDISLPDEIRRIKKDMDIKEHKHPSFWTIIRRDFNKTYEQEVKKCKRTKEKINKNIVSKINPDLVCPMNCIYDMKIREFKPSTSTLPMSDFFVKHEMDEHRRKSKKVEELIQKYSLDLYNKFQKSNEITGSVYIDEDTEDDNYLLLRNDFDCLINDIKSIYISKNYLGLMSWLIDRAFCITVGAKRNQHWSQSKTKQNKAILLKILYSINPNMLLQCFNGENK